MDFGGCRFSELEVASFSGSEKEPGFLVFVHGLAAAGG